MLIPATLLPPRYQKLGQGHDMLIIMDDLQRLRIRWSGQRLEEYHPLTPRQVEKLIATVIERIARYQVDLQTFSQFVADVGERPPEDECPLDVPWKSLKLEEVEKGAPEKTILQLLAEKAKAAEAEEEQNVIAVIHTDLPLEESNMGGESPIGITDMGL
jgi:hypothetical protein